MKKNMDLSKLKTPKSKNILKDDHIEKKPKKELLTAKKIMLSLRPSERLNLEEIAEKKALGLGPLVRHILKKHGYI